MNYYQPNMGYTNPYFNQQFQTQPMQQNFNSQMQQPIQQQTPIFKQQTGLQGKSVDNIEVVKATDIPLDFSISYFPLTDGTAIVTKQLMQDGTSKMIVYKPVENGETEIKTPKYLTENDLEDALKKYDNKDIINDIKTLKKQIKSLNDDIEDLKEGKE